VVDKAAVAALSSITFIVFMPALLFRAMANTEFSNLTPVPVLIYFGATGLMMFGTVVYQRLKGRSAPVAATVALTTGFSNLAMMGIPIVRLALGERGLAVLLTIIAFHALVLLTTMTVVAEAGGKMSVKHLSKTVVGIFLHPVIVPIMLGLFWSFISHRFEFGMPESFDRALEVLSGGAAPLALVLLGCSLGQFSLKENIGEASLLVIGKLVLHPLLVFGLGLAFNVDQLTLAVLCVAACMPAGANAYLFAQRYNTKLGAVSAAIGLATIASVPLLTAVLHYFNP
jgi:malonate transporter and related proteins